MFFSALRRFRIEQPDTDSITHAFTRCFNTDDGKKVLEHLHRQTLFRITDPQLSETQLRFIEGQRQLVLWMCQMAAQPSSQSAQTPSTSPHGDISHG